MRKRIPDLGKLLFVLPNLFTMSSVLCGFYAIVVLAGIDDSDRSLLSASLAIVFAGFFDAMDGRVARLTRTQTDFGVQLDSLADLISFGVAPALLVHEWVLQDLGSAGLITSFLFLAAGAARLARFNVMSARGDNPSDVFVGLSIPLAAVALVSLVIAGVKLETNATEYVNYIAGYILVIAALQVSTVRFRSFKNLQLSTQSLVGGIIALGAPIGIAVWMKQPWLMLVFFSAGYILWGITEHVVGLFTPSSEQNPAAQNAD